MVEMQKLIDSDFNKSTRVIEAVFPRANPQSTLVPHKDKLNIVYDVYNPTNLLPADSKPKVNLLFLHGSGMSRCIWEYYVAHLQDVELNWNINKMVLMDQVTHGDAAILNKDKLGVNFDWSDGARDASKVAEIEFSDGVSALNIVIGHSMGGFQALSCGILRPNLFDLIVTIEPVTLMPNKPGITDRTVLPVKLYQALVSKTRDTFKNVEEYENYMMHSSFFKATDPEILQRIINFEKVEMPDGRIKTKMNHNQNLICYMTLFPTAYWLLSSVKYIKAPVVNLVAEHGNWSPKDSPEMLKRHIKNYTCDVVPGADHLMNIEMPQEILSRILCHISKFVSQQKPLGRKDLSVDERHRHFNKQFKDFRANRIEDSPRVLAKF